MTARTVCVVTGSRADYGLLRPVMLEARRRMALQVIATGMHLVPAVGSTYAEIEKDGIVIDALVSSVVSGDDPPANAKSIGLGILGMTDALRRLQPDVALLLGDRSEILAAAIATSFSGLVLGHVHGGDSPRGGYDEYARHAITKLAHLHFPATAASAERIVRLGERPEHVHVVGAPGLDSVLHAELPDSAALAERYGVEAKRFILFVLHPLSTDPGSAADELRCVLDGTLAADLPVVAVYPNTDPGGDAMRRALEGLGGRVTARPNIPHLDYLALLRDCAALVGNSSSGIIEAPSFRTPVVNVGPRQEGRERAGNVLDAPIDAEAVGDAIRTVLHDAAFRARLAQVSNPYGDGNAARRIVDVLESVELGPEIRRKRLTY